MKDGNDVPHIVKLLKEKLSIAICLPVQPTLDAVAAALALYLSLLKEGKQASVVCADQVNPDFILPGQEHIVSEIQAPGDTLVVSIPIQGTGVENVTYTIENEHVNIVIKPEEGLEKFHPKNVKYTYAGGKPDILVTVYAPTLDALGELYTRNIEAFQNVDIVNIDRHFTNANFGTLNMVDKQSPSMAQMVFDILKELKTEFDKDIATNLYAGLSTATNNFSAHTVNAHTFRLAALLLEKGAEKRVMRPMGMGALRPQVNTGAGFGATMPISGGFAQPPAYPFQEQPFDTFNNQMAVQPVTSQPMQAQSMPQRISQPQPTPVTIPHLAPQPEKQPPKPPKNTDIQPGSVENKEISLQDDTDFAQEDAEDVLRPKIFQGPTPQPGGGGMRT